MMATTNDNPGRTTVAAERNTGQLPVLNRFARAKLLDGPTPIQRLTRLEQALGETGNGVRLYVKRDDFMSLAGGGNKLRKLEFLLGDALAQQADTLITTGGIQSNHCRLSAAAAARMGIFCELILTRMIARDDKEYRRNGNVLLDGILGATIHELEDPSQAVAFMDRRAAELKAEGRRPFIISAGGSVPIGCLGYAACAAEIVEQEKDIDGGFAYVVIPNGGGGTHSGLAAGFTALRRDPSMVRAFAVMGSAEDARQKTLSLARAALSLLDSTAAIEAAAIRVDDGQLGEGYGVTTSAMFEAVRLMARTEGLLLDPVYSGKAFAGLLADIRNGVFRSGEALLFIMTGGVPGLFAYRSAFDQP